MYHARKYIAVFIATLCLLSMGTSYAMELRRGKRVNFDPSMCRNRRRQWINGRWQRAGDIDNPAIHSPADLGSHYHPALERAHRQPILSHDGAPGQSQAAASLINPPVVNAGENPAANAHAQPAEPVQAVHIPGCPHRILQALSDHAHERLLNGVQEVMNAALLQRAIAMAILEHQCEGTSEGWQALLNPDFEHSSDSQSAVSATSSEPSF